jgi:Icc-related predicted phosphoesterase
VAYRHRGSLAWLRKELETPFSGPTVVITHHAPSMRSNPLRFAGSPISGAFYTHLDDLIEETQPVLWIHGHMHNSSDYRIGKTRVVCNPYGIAWEDINPEWNPEVIVEV